jgi:hypothetical protein
VNNELYNPLKEGGNVKRTVLILGVITLSLLFGCNYQKSEKLPPEKKLELAEKCSNAGKAYFKDFIRTSLPEGFMYDEPEYHYSSSLNTCLIHIRYVSSAGDVTLHYNQVIDIFSNKPLLYGYFERDNKTKSEKLSDTFNDSALNFTSTEFFKRKDKMFKE